MRQQIKVSGVWTDGIPELNEWYRQQVGTFPDESPVWQEQRNVPSAAPVDPIKLVGMGEFGELLPDAVLIELEDFKSNTGTVAGKRQAAARVLTRINSNVKVDVLHNDFAVLLTQIVTHTTLTEPQATAILSTLQS